MRIAVDVRNVYGAAHVNAYVNCSPRAWLAHAMPATTRTELDAALAHAVAELDTVLAQAANRTRANAW
jgi:hypothetical protein